MGYCDEWAVRIGLAVSIVVLACSSSALADPEDAGEPRSRRNTFTLEPTVMVGGLPPRGDWGGIYQYLRVVSPRLAWLTGLKVRMIGIPFGGESIGAGEVAAGVRYFPGGSAPSGFHLGGHASLGIGGWVDRTSTLLGGEEEILDSGNGVTWSTVGELGWQWISKGGFAFGLHLDLGAGTTSLQEGKSGLFAGAGYSIGGAW